MLIQWWWWWWLLILSSLLGLICNVWQIIRQTNVRHIRLGGRKKEENSLTFRLIAQRKGFVLGLLVSVRVDKQRRQAAICIEELMKVNRGLSTLWWWLAFIERFAWSEWVSERVRERERTECEQQTKKMLVIGRGESKRFNEIEERVASLHYLMVVKVCRPVNGRCVGGHQLEKKYFRWRWQGWYGNWTCGAQLCHPPPPVKMLGGDLLTDPPMHNRVLSHY